MLSSVTKLVVPVAATVKEPVVPAGNVSSDPVEPRKDIPFTETKSATLAGNTSSRPAPVAERSAPSPSTSVALLQAEAPEATDLSQVRREAEAARQSYLTQSVVDGLSAPVKVSSTLSAVSVPVAPAQDATASTSPEKATPAGLDKPARSILDRAA